MPGTDPAGAGNPTGNWELEEALDIEWAHALAPKASIVLVEASSDSDPNNFDLFHAVATAASLPGVSAVSMSWGLDEFNGINEPPGQPNIPETTVDPTFTTPAGHQGVTFFAAAGDSGSPGDYPAYSPNVVAVGGTTLNLNDDDTYNSEVAWSGSGGGTSKFEAEPAYQGTVQSTGQRTIPDVAFDADPNSGVAVYDAYNDTDGSGPWIQIGGTSVASPCWAAIVAVCNQGRILGGGSTLDGPTQTLPYLYDLPSTDFHDILTGSNGGFKAGPGYDEVTGRGSPIPRKFVRRPGRLRDCHPGRDRGPASGQRHRQRQLRSRGRHPGQPGPRRPVVQRPRHAGPGEQPGPGHPGGHDDGQCRQRPGGLLRSSPA